ncbi:hypothetical protein [Thiomonas sp.]|uniref:hypothetical protein n=1 Tax=Thiomonas sp. TaxID=2047785 RepID=UPI0026281FC7|nr:hypothetical protein [Thiomonas sp.]
MSIFLLWFVQTSVMPLCVGAATGALAGVAWRGGCAAGWARRAGLGALASWGVHLALVGGGLLREGSVWDYAAVVVAGVTASEWVCRRAAHH